MKKYFEVKENEHRVTHIKCEVYYSLGGFNCFSYKREGRGYYASVTPVERRDYGGGMIMEGFVAFTGVKQLVKAVSRKSAKAQAEAEKLAENVFDSMIEYILNKEGLELAIKVAERESVETVA